MEGLKRQKTLLTQNEILIFQIFHKSHVTIEILIQYLFTNIKDPKTFNFILKKLYERSKNEISFYVP